MTAAAQPAGTGTVADAWLQDVVACLEAGKSVRQDFGDGERLHIDRPLPFLCVHVTGGNAHDAARDAASANASYLICHDRDHATAIIRVVGDALQRRFGAVILLDIDELERDALLSDDVPYLPPFEVTISATQGDAAAGAAEAFATAAASREAKFRTPHIERRRAEDDPHARLAALEMPFAVLTVRFAPIYRQPGSERIYPGLKERLVANMFDAGLQAFAAFIVATQTAGVSSHRALGRKAFVDAVSRADRSIDEVAASFDFLLAVTPINADAAWQAFQADPGRAPTLLYRPLTVEVEAEKRKLFTIAFDRFEDPVLYQLYREKQQELDLQLSMMSARETPRFIEFGRALYGPVAPALVTIAENILQQLATRHPPGEAGTSEIADCYAVARRAEAMIAAYRSVHADFDAVVELRDDLPPGLMVSGPRLLISRDTRMDAGRVEALLSHEVGVHLLTYFTGSAQGLRLFRSGLAGYEGMQEGLAVFAEFLSGGMTVDRLRLIAARTVACAAMLDNATFSDTFRMLVDDHQFKDAAAFNIVLRLYRGGGLAKDAIYLRGLLDVLAHMQAGGALEPFWMGKIAAGHFPVMQELAARGLLGSPAVRPLFLDTPAAKLRLKHARAGLSPLDMIDTTGEL